MVITDGADTKSQTSLEDLLDQVKFDNERKTIRIFTIGYGPDARKDVLDQDSERHTGQVLRRHAG